MLCVSQGKMGVGVGGGLYCVWHFVAPKIHRIRFCSPPIAPVSHFPSLLLQPKHQLGKAGKPQVVPKIQL